MDNLDFHKFWAEGLTPPPPRPKNTKRNKPMPTGEIYQPTPHVSCHCCDFRNLPVEPESVTAVVTDIPYKEDWRSNIPAFAEWCCRVLVPGGTMVTFYGHACLNECMAALGLPLRYRWLLVSPLCGIAGTHGQFSPRYQLALVYSKGDDWRLPRVCEDWIPAGARDKRHHDHQKTIAQMQWLVEAFSSEGELVVDNCAGSFTTAEACHITNRRFIGADINPECLNMARKRFARFGSDNSTGSASITT
jgi:hypothetical protein